MNGLRKQVVLINYMSYINQIKFKYKAKKNRTTIKTYFKSATKMVTTSF